MMPNVGPHGERFTDSHVERDLQAMPGPGQYALPSGHGRQVSSLFKSNRATSFAPPGQELVGEGAYEDLRRAALQRVQRKLLHGRRAIEALATMWNPERNSLVSQRELERGLLALGLPLTQMDLDVLFELFGRPIGAQHDAPAGMPPAPPAAAAAAAAARGINLRELREAVQGGLEVLVEDEGNANYVNAAGPEHVPWAGLMRRVGVDVEEGDGLTPQPPKGAPTRVAAPRRKPKRRVVGGSGGGVLGSFQLSSEDNAKPMAEQLRNALTRQAARVIDLFREWDTSQDMSLSRKEFLDGVTRLGLPVDSEVRAGRRGRREFEPRARRLRFEPRTRRLRAVHASRRMRLRSEPAALRPC